MKKRLTRYAALKMSCEAKMYLEMNGKENELVKTKINSCRNSKYTYMFLFNLKYRD